MGRFIFTYEGEIFEGPEKSITLEVGEDISLNDLLNEIQNFLRSAGYYFGENSYLDIVTPDKFEQPEVNDLKEWRETNWTSNKEDNIDGPTEFAFNGLKENDFPEIKLDPETQVKVNQMVEDLNKGLYKGEQFMPAKVGLKGHGKGRCKLGSKKRKARNKNRNA